MPRGNLGLENACEDVSQYLQDYCIHRQNCVWVHGAIPSCTLGSCYSVYMRRKLDHFNFCNNLHFHFHFQPYIRDPLQHIEFLLLHKLSPSSSSSLHLRSRHETPTIAQIGSPCTSSNPFGLPTEVPHLPCTLSTGTKIQISQRVAKRVVVIAYLFQDHTCTDTPCPQAKRRTLRSTAATSPRMANAWSLLPVVCSSCSYFDFYSLFVLS